jgi:hypothetical protein
MSINFQEILKELEYRVKTGIIDLTNEEQVTTLKQILRENGISDANEIAQKARVYYSFLKEERVAPPQGKTWVKNKQSGAIYAVGKVDTAVHDSPSDKEVSAAKASGALSSDEPKEEPKQQGPNAFGVTGGGAKVFPGNDNQPKDDGRAQKRSGEPTQPEKRAPQVLGKLDDKVLRQVEQEYVKQNSGDSADMGNPNPKYPKKDMAEGYSDKEYYSKRGSNGEGHSTRVRTEPFIFDKSLHNDLTNAGFPEEYIKFLERCINTEVDGKQPPVTELIKQGGAGQIQSQFGEVMAMAFMSLRDPRQRFALANVIKQQIQETKLDLLKQSMGAAAFNKLAKDPKALKKALAADTAIATDSWVDASLSHGESFDAAMDEKYGKGGWQFQGAAWDKREDIEALGLPYAQKGFSTDVLLRVQPLKNGKPAGPAQAQRCSLKKDENIMFFNGSVNEVENFILNYVTDGERSRTRALESLWSKAQDGNKNKEERLAARDTILKLTGAKTWQQGAQMVSEESKAIRDKAFNKAPNDVKQAVTAIREFNDKQTKSALKLGYYASVDLKPKELENAVNSLYKTSADRKFATAAHQIVKQCGKANGEVTQECVAAGLTKLNPKKAGTKYVSKACVAAAEVAKAAGYDVDKQLEQHYSIAKEAGNALIKAIPKSPELLGGVMQKLAEAFPLKVCMDGTEFMLIDGVHVTTKTLQTVFGVNSYDELNKGLTVVEDSNGDALLVFSAGGSKQIPVGYVDARQKGKGFEGTVGFEILCNDEFVRQCAEANKKNGDTSGANSRKADQLAQRKAAGEKRKQSSSDDTNDDEA